MLRGTPARFTQLHPTWHHTILQLLPIRLQAIVGLQSLKQEPVSRIPHGRTGVNEYMNERLD